MKILYISTPSFADCDFPLIKAYQEKNYDVTYLILLRPYSLRSTLFDIKDQLPVNDIITASHYPEMKVYEKYMDMSNVYIANRTTKRDSSFTALILNLKILNFIRKGCFDVIHTDTFMSMWDRLIYNVFRNKIILTIHDPFPHTGESSKRRTSTYRRMIGTIKYFVLLNQNQKDEFCKVYKLSENQICINKLGVYDNIRVFLKPDIKEKKHSVLFFGRISPYKGVEYLCKAMLKVHEQVPDANLIVAGGGKMYFDIEPYRKMPWMDLRNHYIGMDELAEILQQSSVTVCPYTDATQSGVIMTSYSLCKPVIATDVGGLSEMVEGGKSGILVAPKDIDALANAIIKILQNDVLRESMKKYIQNKYFSDNKSWNSIADRYLKFYKTINGKSGKFYKPTTEE